MYAESLSVVSIMHIGTRVYVGSRCVPRTIRLPGSTALLSISGTRLWSGQNAQTYNCELLNRAPGTRTLTFTPLANAISWGALGPQMFGPKGVYHMVPISLAIGLFLPFPFYFAVRNLCARRLGLH